MATLPSISENQLQAPQSGRGMVSYRPSPMGEVLKQAGDAGIKMSTDYMKEQQEKEDKLQQTYASAHLLKGQADILDELSKEQDYNKIPKLFNEKMALIRQEASGMISSQSRREQFDAESVLHTNQSLSNVYKLADGKRREYGQASSMQNFDDLIERANNTSDPALGSAMLKNANSIIDAAVSNEFYTPAQGYEAKKKGAEKYGTTWLENLTPQERLKYLTPSKSSAGAESAISTVLKNEGGHVAVDGSSGHPAIYGINAKWHPEAYAEAKGIADTKGAAAGKEYAAQFYKKEYWDKYNIDSLPPEAQTIVMDGAVNHRVDFVKDLVQAAKSGEPPEALMQMRRDEYKRLATSSPDKYGQSLDGWNKRLDGLGSVYPKTNSPADFIPTDKKAELYQRDLQLIRADQKLKIDDPAAWGLKYGMSLNQIVEAQQNPQTASVIPKESASQITQQLMNAQKPEEIAQFANDLKQEYGDYAPNAVNDLKRAKLPDEHEAMLSLALDNPVKNNEAISLLMDAAKVGSKGIDEAYKLTVTTGIFTSSPGDPKIVDEKVVSDSGEFVKSMLNEGYSFEEVSRNIAITSTLAKAYQIKNPSAGVEDATAFAMRQVTEKYKFAELNGIKYRVPIDYDVNAVEDRIQQFYAAMEFSTGKGDIASNADAHLKEIAAPFLNAKKDGIRFRAPNGELLLDKSGKPAELNFDAVISNETPREKLTRTTGGKAITNYLLPTGGF